MILAILLSLFASLPTHAATRPPFDVAKLDRAIATLESNQRLRGSVAITKDGKVVYSRTFGLRDDRKKVDPETMIRIGSITKVFTAAMIYQLIDEKKLTLTTPLDRFFPEIPNAQRITIAHLLAHATGIPNYPKSADYSSPDSWIHHPQTKAQMVARFAADKPDFEPGTKVSYSNANYVLLGYIIEAVTHSTYDRQLQKRIARPLGLRRTRFGGHVDPANNEAHSYTFDDGKWVESPEDSPSIAAGAGAITSTPQDLGKFITALFAGRLIRPGSVHEMITPFSAALDGVERKGVVVSTLHRGLEKTIYSHLGGIDAFSSNLVYFPEDKVAIAITLNGQNYPMGKLFWLLADSYYGRSATIPNFEPITLPADTLEQYKGVYSFKQIGMDITVTRDGDQLRAQATGQDAFPLEAIGETLFWDRSAILIEFRRGDDGKVASITLYQGRSEMNFVRRGNQDSGRP
jgi:CubicO group peptidase (beta-lactamase class C family)